jgi:DNA-binding transcriptional ArsR family regulator
MDEQHSPARRSTRLTDPRALRAYAHPVRVALVGLLRTEGPLTATRAAEILGESSGTCSFHLRQLAKYGLVEEAGGGTGREKPWRATALFTEVPATADTPEGAAAAGLFFSVLAEGYFDRLMKWLEVRGQEAQEWQEAAIFGDRILYLTPDELAGLGARIAELLDAYTERLTDPQRRPEGSRQVTYVQFTFPGQQPASGHTADHGGEAG